MGIGQASRLKSHSPTLAAGWKRKRKGDELLHLWNLHSCPVNGAPIAVALSITTLVFIIITTNIPIHVLAQQMFSSINTSLLLGVLFFILAETL
jgi:hypothetical protein